MPLLKYDDAILFALTSTFFCKHCAAERRSVKGDTFLKSVSLGTYITWEGLRHFQSYCAGRNDRIKYWVCARSHAILLGIVFLAREPHELSRTDFNEILRRIKNKRTADSRNSLSQALMVAKDFHRKTARRWMSRDAILLNQHAIRLINLLQLENIQVLVHLSSNNRNKNISIVQIHFLIIHNQPKQKL